MLGGIASRTDPAALKTHLDGIRGALDVDGNRTSDASTDGMIILRYLFGIRGEALIQGAIGAGATRKTFSEVQAFLQALTP